MNKLALVSGFFLLTSPHIASASCQQEIGKKANFLSPDETIDLLETMAIEKDEFETTAEFETRRNKIIDQSSLSSILVRASYSIEHVNYDADNQRFLISRYAWGNLSGNFHEVFGLRNLYGIEEVTIIDNVLGAGLHLSEEVVDVYDASNALGTTVQVLKLEQKRISIFDRVFQDGESTWQFDYIEGESRYSVRGGVFLPVERSIARELRDKLQFGFYFTPREPLLARGNFRLFPNINRRTDVAEEVITIVGDIHCVVIADDKGIVLRTVLSARQ